MGRSLGYYDSDELDRPELNKCPDCECFFASDECPLCGKICPEEMRAGNRAKVKPPKKRKNSSGRVQFIPWYHSWWFILLMMYFMPIAGIIQPSLPKIQDHRGLRCGVRVYHGRTACHVRVRTSFEPVLRISRQ